jgi:hypothetical protein
MTGLAYKAALCVLIGLLGPSTVMASGPKSWTSTIPHAITLVGTKDGVADPLGEFSVTIRDGSSNLVAGSTVVIDFDGCTPDIRVCATQPHEGLSVGCVWPPGKITGITNQAGTATFRIVGAAQNTGNGPGAGFDCAKIFADGVPMGSVNVGAPDQDGLGGVNASDISLLVADIFAGSLRGRSDLNNSRSVNASDISSLLVCLFGGGSASSCGAFCH